MSDVIKEYLVALGYDTNEPSLDKFKRFLDVGAQSVARSASGMAKAMLEGQATILGVFASVGAAAVGLADKVAMADQNYRLMGLRMLMTADSARKLDFITKGLGADLASIVWDRELHERALVMSQDIDRMSAALGPGFEDRMRGIRDIRFEFTRLETAMKFLGMQVVGDLFRKLDLGDVGGKVHDWVTWFEAHIPELSDKFTTYLAPALRTTWNMLVQMGEVLKSTGLLFTNLVGLLTMDTSIQGAAFNFENLGKAIGHVGDWLAKFFGWIAHAEQLLAHLFSATSLMLTGRFSEAGKELKEAIGQLGTGSGAVLGAAIGSVIPGVGTLAGAAIGAAAGAGAEKGREDNEQAAREYGIAPREKSGRLGGTPAARLGSIVSGAQESIDRHVAALTKQLRSKADLVSALEDSAERNGVSPSLALAVAQHESGIRQDRTSRVGAIGVMQLMPATAKGLGVNPYDAAQNIEGGVRFLAQLLQRYGGDEAKALAAYNWGPGRVKVNEPLDLNRVPEETRKYVPSILALQQQFEQARKGLGPSAAAQSGVPIFGAAQDTKATTANSPMAVDRYSYPEPAVAPSVSHETHLTIEVGDVYVTRSNADPRDIGAEVAAHARAVLSQDSRVNQLQFSPVY